MQVTGSSIILKWKKFGTSGTFHRGECLTKVSNLRKWVIRCIHEPNEPSGSIDPVSIIFGGKQVLYFACTISPVKQDGGSLPLPSGFKQLERGAKTESFLINEMSKTMQKSK